MAISILSCIIVSVVLTVGSCYNLCGKRVPCFDGDVDEQYQKINHCKQILNFGSKILQIPFAIWAFAKAA
jgi:hypothetical protein